MGKEEGDWGRGEGSGKEDKEESEVIRWACYVFIHLKLICLLRA